MSVARQNTLVRQHQIMEAARNLIAIKGMDGVTIDAIAEEVGLTEGAIYRHFTSKHQILSLLVDDIESNLLDTVGRAQLQGASAVDSLRHILEAHLSDVEGHRAVSFIVIAEAMGFDGNAAGSQGVVDVHPLPGAHPGSPGSGHYGRQYQVRR